VDRSSDALRALARTPRIPDLHDCCFTRAAIPPRGLLDNGLTQNAIGRPAQEPRPMLRFLSARTNAVAYLLMTLTMLFWSINFIVGRWAAGHVPPITLSALRWTGATLLILTVAWPHVRREWSVIRCHWPMLLMLGITGTAVYNTLQYLALVFTTATSAGVINSAGPVLIVLACYIFFGDRVSPRQAFGIAVSLLGVLIVITKGDLGSLLALSFNIGDVIMLSAMVVTAVYTAYLRKRPPLHMLSFAAVIYAIAAVLNLPLALVELAAGAHLDLSPASLAAIAYTAIFPSALAYLCFNRGIEIIGGPRAGAFLHLIPLFTAALAMLFLGEQPQPFHAAGFAFIVGGVALAARRA
jgi:drug/metabolite transporter (DMT)-like permease